MFNLLAGNYELAVGNIVIPPQLLGDLNPNYEEGQISAETQGGVVTQPSGKAETSEFTFTLFLPRENAMRYIGVIFPDLYKAPTSETQKSGNITVSTQACKTRTPVVMNIHNSCDTTDDNDIFIPAAMARFNFSPNLSATDAASIEITVDMQPDENGDRFRFGTGDLSQPSRWDPTQGKTVPVTPPEE